MTHASSEQESLAESRREQWIALYDEHSANVWRYVASLVGSDSAAVGDAVQETFMAAGKNFEQFDPRRGTAFAWLSGIAHRQVALYWRRRTRDRIEVAGTPVEEAAEVDDPAAGLMEQETAERVRRVLALLPAQSATLLQGKYCDGLSVAELVRRLGGTTESVRSRLARARRDFRSQFERSEGQTTSTPPESPLGIGKRNSPKTGGQNG